MRALLPQSWICRRDQPRSPSRSLRGLGARLTRTREVFAEVSPRVEYTSSTLGPRCSTHVRTAAGPLGGKSVQSCQDYRRIRSPPTSAGKAMPPLGIKGVVASFREKMSAFMNQNSLQFPRWHWAKSGCSGRRSLAFPGCGEV